MDVHPSTPGEVMPFTGREGADIRRLQLLLGHNNLNPSQTFLRFSDADLSERYNKIEFEALKYNSLSSFQTAMSSENEILSIVPSSSI